MVNNNKFVLFECDGCFFDVIENVKYNCEIIMGLQKFVDGEVLQDM